MHKHHEHKEEHVIHYHMYNCIHCDGRGYHHGIHCHRIKACKSCKGTGLILAQLKENI
jgi:DnaJ-class molecular chaperone